MTDRIPLDSLTSDQYDTLLDERDRLRAELTSRNAALDELRAVLSRPHLAPQPQTAAPAPYPRIGFRGDQQKEH